MLQDFSRLTIQPGETSLQQRESHWELSQPIRLDGSGGYLAATAISKVNALESPFVFHWQQRGSSPLNWVLISVEHPGLEMNY